MKMKYLITIVVALALSGCGAMGMNKQQYAGINFVTLQTGGGCSADSLNNQDTCKVRMVDGKEKGNVKIKVILADGTTYEYSAGDEKAFEGQKIRADVDKAAVEAVSNAAKAVADKVAP